MRPRADQSQGSTAGGAQAQKQATAKTSSEGKIRSGSTVPLRRGPQVERLEAAASLLGDDSPLVRSALRREFSRAGRLGAPLLRRAARSDDARVRSHARKILEFQREHQVIRRLHRFAASGVKDLERGLLMLSRLDRSDVDMRPYKKALDAMAAEVDKRSRHLNDELARGQVLVQYLGTELGFCGDLDSYTLPDNIHFTRVIETRRGLPLSLCALYSFVARRCMIHTGIVPLPGHVMLRLYGRHQNLIVDPFHGGESKSQEDLVHYLKQHGLSFDPVWMHDASPLMLFRRQVSNLRNSYRSMGQSGRGARLMPLIEQLSS
jgi:regulator of sirC expression with transglutaminase-like and TPR domain